ncbi:MAG: hypothetical protein RL571_2265 [Pseudomonadota bacterium]
MKYLDFNLLLDLDALLREGSVVGAARALHLSPPAMSRRLTRLREAIGDPLFVPAGRGLVPTPRALALHARVRAAIEEVRGVFTPQEVDFTRLQRTFTLRANDGFLGAWASQLAAALLLEAPDISLHFVSRADKNIEALRNGSIDLDVGVAGRAEPEVYSQPLFSASFVGVVREGHPLAGQVVSAEDFVAWPHISASRRGQEAGRMDAALNALGLQRRVAMVAPGFQAALMMAASSDFITAMPEPFVRWAMPQHRLYRFELPVMMASVEVSQSWHTRHHADPVHRWLREHVQAICRDDA